MHAYTYSLCFVMLHCSQDKSRERECCLRMLVFCGLSLSFVDFGLASILFSNTNRIGNRFENWSMFGESWRVLKSRMFWGTWSFCQFFCVLVTTYSTYSLRYDSSVFCHMPVTFEKFQSTERNLELARRISLNGKKLEWILI